LSASKPASPAVATKDQIRALAVEKFGVALATVPGDAILAATLKALKGATLDHLAYVMDDRRAAVLKLGWLMLPKLAGDCAKGKDLWEAANAPASNDAKPYTCKACGQPCAGTFDGRCFECDQRIQEEFGRQQAAG
jgi:hypothetical protein